MMMSHEELVSTLAEHAPFDRWRPSELDQLVRRCRPRVAHHGESLWATGEPGQRAFILIQGRVERSQHVRPDGHRFWHVEQPGSLLSLTSLVEPWPHTSSGTPLESSLVLELDREVFLKMFHEEHPVAYLLLDAVAEQVVQEMRDANRRVQQVFGQPAETLRMLRRRLRDQELA